jgi:diguanylate cyclase (GGDEF)-like protein/PAS domain S-box-containing protein
MSDLVRADILAQVIDSIAEGVYILDIDGRIAFWSKGAERITGYPKEEAVGRLCSDNLLRHVDEKGRELCIEGCSMRAAMKECEPMEGDIFLHHKDGHRVPVVVHASPIFDLEDAGSPIGAFEVFSDRSERSNLLSELESLRKEVLTDPLTGLGNRRYAEISAESAIGELEAKGVDFGLIIMDIDRFKNVNDDYGHAIGDRVLRMIGWTLANAVRRRDAAIRWGGEEFIVICPHIEPSVLAEVAERARVLIERSWIGLEDGRKLGCTVSVGGAMAHRGDSLESLVARADERLYESKTAGRNRVTVGG